MIRDGKMPITHEDNNELLGFIIQDVSGWDARTIFGYTISRVETREEAEKVVRSQGLSALKGLWEYLDSDDHEWYPCILKEVYEHKVVVIRTSSMGYQDPNDYKLVTIKKPSETNLIKS